MIQIRDMAPEDCPEVSRLQAQCFSTPWSQKSLEETFRVKGYTNLIVKKEGRLLGYIGFLAAMEEADITNVAVAPSCRRQGIGKALLDHLKERAAQQKISRIFLEVRASNKAAVALYEQAGFHRVTVRKNYYEKPREDALIMVWEKNGYQ